MSMEEFDARVAWPGDQPSSSGGGGASAALEPMIEEPLIPVAAAAAKEETHRMAEANRAFAHFR